FSGGLQLLLEAGDLSVQVLNLPAGGPEVAQQLQPLVLPVVQLVLQPGRPWVCLPDGRRLLLPPGAEVRHLSLGEGEVSLGLEDLGQERRRLPGSRLPLRGEVRPLVDLPELEDPPLGGRELLLCFRLLC